MLKRARTLSGKRGSEYCVTMPKMNCTLSSYVEKALNHGELYYIKDHAKRYLPPQ